MKTKFLSAHIDATTGKVAALTESGCYVYKKLLDTTTTEKLMKKLESATEIETDHWDLEWELNKLGS